MSGLNGRVRTLERQERHAAGCPLCGDQMIHVMEPGESLSWLDEASCCRGCGAGVKVYPRALWDRIVAAGIDVP
jgi:hypothetical protein